jgi:hypothetical protein
VNSWKIILATIVIFGAGVIAGGLLVNHVERTNRNSHRPPWAAEGRPPGGEREPGRGMEFPRPRQPELFGRESKDFMRQLDEMLKLTSGQHDAIQEIIADGQSQMQKAVQSVRQDTRLKVRDQLAPDQQKQFDDLMRRAPRRPPNATPAPPVSLPTNAPGASTNAPGA